MRRIIFAAIGVFLLDLYAIAAPADAPLRPTVRIEPQLKWPDRGIASPDGSLFVGHGGHSVRLVSVRGELVWRLPLFRPNDAAFSPDGRWLAACGLDEGFLLDLRTCKYKSLPKWRGLLVRFTPDSRHILLVHPGTNAEWSGKEPPPNGELAVYDLDGQQTGSFPIGMDVPQVLEAPPDGATVRVHGAHGNPHMHVLSMGKADETIHLDTGQTEREWGPAQRGGMPHQDDPRLVALPALRDKKVVSHYEPHGLWWNEASGLSVHGPYVWDIRRANFVRTLGTNNSISEIGGFVGSETILARAWSDRKPRLAQIDVRTGELASIPLDFARSSLSPDHKCLCYLAGRKSDEQRLELYRMPPTAPFHSTADTSGAGIHTWSSVVWSRDSQFMAYIGPQRWPSDAWIVSVADGRAVQATLGDVQAAHSTRNEERPHIWRLALDDSGKQLAVGMGWTKFGLLAIADCKTGRVETVIDGLSSLVKGLEFVGPGRLLIATGDGHVQLWDLPTKKALWTTATRDEVLQFNYVPNSPYVVCGTMYRGGVVLQLADGKPVYRTPHLWSGDSSVTLSWTQPIPIGDGRRGLEMDPECAQLRLIDFSTGRTLLSYCALPSDQWIVYIPGGDWDGSAEAPAWVKFYRGLDPLSAAELEQYHRPDRIRAMLKEVFP